MSLGSVRWSVHILKENKSQSSWADLLSYYAPLSAATLNTIFLVAAILQISFRTASEITTPPPMDLVALMLPSLFLAPAYVLTTVAIHRYASDKAKFWSQASIAFAGIYAVFVSFAYFVVMTVVVPHQIAGTTAQIQVLVYEQNSFLYAINVLGYGYMSLSTFFAAPVFSGDGLEKYAHIFLFGNGILAPFIPLQMVFPWLFYVSALQGLTFPVSMVLVARVLKQSKNLG